MNADSTYRPRHSARVALLIFLGLFAFYVAIQRADLTSYDGKAMVNVAENLVKRGALRMTITDPLAGSVDTGESSFGQRPFYSLGVTVFVIPFLLIQWAVNPKGKAIITLLSPVLLSVSAVIIYRIGIDLRWTRLKSLAAALVFGLLTMAPQYSVELFSEPGVALGAVVQLLGIERWRNERTSGPWLVGTGLALSGFFRTDAVLFGGLAIVGCLFLLKRQQIFKRSTLLGLGIPIIAIGLWIGYYNWIRFDSPFVSGYERFGGFITPLRTGLDLLLFGGRGFFWFNPLLILSVGGMFLLLRKSPPLTTAILLMSVARLFFYAKWSDPAGGTSWGPRLLFPLCALLTIPAIEGADRLLKLRRPWRFGGVATVTGLALISAAVTFASVWVPFEQWLRMIREPSAGISIAEANREVAAREYRFNKTLRGSMLVGNFRILQTTDPFPLVHFRGGPKPVGVGALTVSLVALAFAWGTARSTSTEELPPIQAKPATLKTGRDLL